MATDRTPSKIQVLITPDPAVSAVDAVWKSESQFTEQDAIPSAPVASVGVRIEARAGGTPRDPTKSLVVSTVRAGLAPDSELPGMLGWRYDGDVPPLVRGREAPLSIQGGNCLGLNTGPTVKYQDPDVVTTDQETLLVAYVTASGAIQVARRPLAGPWSVGTSVYVAHGGNGEASHPALLALPDSRIVLYYWTSAPSGSTKRTLQASYSDDDGATWQAYTSRAVLSSDLAGSVAFTGTGGTYEVGQTRVAYSQGQVVLLVHLVADDGTAGVYVDNVRHYASSDLGATFYEVETANGAAWPDVVGLDEGGFVVNWIDKALVWQGHTLSGAFQPLSDAIAAPALATWDNFLAVAVTVGAGPATRLTEGSLAMARADDGAIYTFLHSTDPAPSRNEYAGQVIVSYDAGETWSGLGVDPVHPTNAVDAGYYWCSDSSAGDYLDRMAATWQGGRAVLASNWIAHSTGQDDSLLVSYLGGWSTHLAPRERSATSVRNWSCFERTYWPIEEAYTQSGWTRTTSGTANSNLDMRNKVLEQQIHTQGTLGSMGTYQLDTTEVVASNPGARVQWAVDTDSAEADGRVALQARVDDGTHGVEIAIRNKATGIEVYDVVAGSTLATLNYMGSGAKQFRLGLHVDDSGTTREAVLVWRPYDPSTEDRNAWQEVGSWTLADDGGSVGSCRVRWGHLLGTLIVNPQTDVWSYWAEVQHTFGDSASDADNLGSYWPWWDSLLASNPEPLWGAPWGKRLAYAANGVTVGALDGPAIEGETVTIGVTGRYPVESVIPAYALSPRTKWRSMGDGVVETIALQAESEQGDDPTGVKALVLRGCNWREGKILRHDGTSWVTVLTFDLAKGNTGLTYSRGGATFTPGGADAQQIRRGQWDGWIASTNGGSTLRRVQSTRGGRWDATAKAKARITVESPDAADPTSGSDLALVSPDAVILFEPGGPAKGWKILINGGTTPDGYFTIGEAWVGDAHVLGQVPSWGTSRTVERGVEITETPSGYTSITHRAPDRRVWDISWSDGIDTTQHYGGSEPDYVLAGTEGHTVSGTALDLQGLAEEMGAGPVAYAVSVGTTLPLTITDPDSWIVGYAGNSVRIEVIQGDEVTDEVVRVATVTIRETV